MEEKGVERVTRISSPGGGTWTSSQDTSLSAESLQHCILGFDGKVWKLKSSKDQHLEHSWPQAGWEEH